MERNKQFYAIMHGLSTIHKDTETVRNNLINYKTPIMSSMFWFGCSNEPFPKCENVFNILKTIGVDNLSENEISMFTVNYEKAMKENAVDFTDIAPRLTEDKPVTTNFHLLLSSAAEAEMPQCKSKIYTWRMCSRNKDNKNVPNFKPRSKFYIDSIDNENKVFEIFEKFAKEGVAGENTRIYRSVNARDENKVRENLGVLLLTKKPSILNINRLLDHCASLKENRAESKWLFDFDVDDEKLVTEFANDIIEFERDNTTPITVEVSKTPHGYAVVVSRGFDTRKLMEKYKDYDISLDKDDLLFLKMVKNV